MEPNSVVGPSLLFLRLASLYFDCRKCEAILSLMGDFFSVSQNGLKLPRTEADEECALGDRGSKGGKSHLLCYRNTRCGDWYVPPSCRPSFQESTKEDASSSLQRNTVQFKSTDGHKDNWSFSTLRLNVHCLSSWLQPEETPLTRLPIVIVDATHNKKKRIPDSFSKTIPIWVYVMNKIYFERQKTIAEKITVPEVRHLFPNCVLDDEIEQIALRLPHFVASYSSILQARQMNNNTSSVDPQHNAPQNELFLRFPILPLWLVASNTSSERVLDDLHTQLRELSARGVGLSSVHVMILLTISGSDGGSSFRRERSSEILPDVPGTSSDTPPAWYVPGAGDDEESWAGALTTQAFHGQVFPLFQKFYSEVQHPHDLLDQFQPEHERALLAALLPPASCVPATLQSANEAVGPNRVVLGSLKRTCALLPQISLILHAVTYRVPLMHERPSVCRAVVLLRYQHGPVTVQEGLLGETKILDVHLNSVLSHSLELSLQPIFDFVQRTMIAVMGNAPETFVVDVGCLTQDTPKMLHIVLGVFCALLIEFVLCTQKELMSVEEFKSIIAESVRAGMEAFGTQLRRDVVKQLNRFFIGKTIEKKLCDVS